MPDTALETRPDPAVMNGVIPYVNFGGRAAEAMDFYARAFGAGDLGRMPGEDGRLMHGQIEINGGALMLTDHGGCETEAPARASGFHLQLVVGDGEAWWTRALEAGCEVEMPYEKQFWGDMWGMVRDPFGLRWAVLQPG